MRYTIISGLLSDTYFNQEGNRIMVSKLPNNFYEAISPSVFDDPNYRPTIAVLLSMGGGLLMVKSVFADAEGYQKWWTLPQEGILPTDGNLACATRRCLEEELGYTPPAECFYTGKVLGSMYNKVPKYRRKDGKPQKHIVFVGMKVPTFQVELNQLENIEYTIARSIDELDDLMSEVATYRVQKYMCTCNMVLNACTCGLLSWKMPKGLIKHARVCA